MENENRNSTYNNKDSLPKDRLFHSGCTLSQEVNKGYIVVDVPLNWPNTNPDGFVYTPPPEDYKKVVEASLCVPISELTIGARSEVERIYYDGLCGGRRGLFKKMTPFKNWVAYVVKCLWTAYNKGLLCGCRPPRTVKVRSLTEMNTFPTQGTMV